jgi:hypothetical protein
MNVIYYGPLTIATRLIFPSMITSELSRQTAFEPIIPCRPAPSDHGGAYKIAKV